MAAYALGALHVLVLFVAGEAYPSLQGPMFCGHLQVGETIYVPFFRDAGTGERDAPRTGRENLLRHETLALPAQSDQSALVPTLPGRAARQFLIGHSLRVPTGPGQGGAGRSPEFEDVRWSAYRFKAPFGSPPQLDGEEDVIHD